MGLQHRSPIRFRWNQADGKLILGPDDGPCEITAENLVNGVLHFNPVESVLQLQVLVEPENLDIEVERVVMPGQGGGSRVDQMTWEDWDAVIANGGTFKSPGKKIKEHLAKLAE